MRINSWDKIKLLGLAYRQLPRLPRGKRLFHFFCPPIASTRYLEFPYLLKYLDQEKVKTAGQVLDVSSPFLMSYILSSRYDKVIKTDINPAEKEMIRDSARLEFKQEDGTKLSFPDNSFALIYSISVIEHIYQKYQDAVREMIRVCAPGGLVYLTFPASKQYQEEWLDYDMYSDQSRQGEKYFFQYRFDEARVKEILSQLANVRIVSYDIFWERHDGAYEAMTSRMRDVRGHRYWQTLKNTLWNLYYGFRLMSGRPADFSAAKSLGNVHLILQKL